MADSINFDTHIEREESERLCDKWPSHLLKACQNEGPVLPGAAAAAGRMSIVLLVRGDDGLK